MKDHAQSTHDVVPRIVRRLEFGDCARWDAFVESTPAATFFTVLPGAT